MAISPKTRAKIRLHKGERPEDDNGQLASALGVVSTVDSRVELSKAEQDLLQSRALTVEDDPWNQLPNERRTNLLKPTYDPVTLIGLCLQNNTLGQCVDALETNIDGTGYEIERRDGKTPEDLKPPAPPKATPFAQPKPNPFGEKKGNPFAEPQDKKGNPFAKAGEPFDPAAPPEVEDELDDAPEGEEPEEEGDDKNIKALKAFFDEAFINESFTSIRRKLRRDRVMTGNAYLEVIRNQAGEITLVNHIDAKLVRMVKLDDPVVVTKSIMRNGSEQKVQMLVRERRYAQLIGNKVRYFREFGSSREVNADTGEWMGPAKKAPPSRLKAPEPRKFQATNDQDRWPPADDGASSPRPPETDVQRDARAQRFQAFKAEDADKNNQFPSAPYDTGPKPEDDPSKRPAHEAQQAVPGSELIHFMDIPDVSTPYGVPRWINQIPSVLGSRKAEELNLEYFNHGGLPPVMIFLQGGQLAPAARDKLNSYLSGEAKNKLRGVIAEVYATGGDLTSNSTVKTSVERFGGDNLADSMFEGYDERCGSRVRSAFRLPPLFTGDTGDYTFATAYASYVVAEAQVFEPERELFDEKVNNTIMKELAPDYVYRSLPLTVVDVAVKIQALNLAKDVTDRKTFVDEVNEVAGLNLTFQDPMTDPSNPFAGLGMMPGAGDPFADPSEAADGNGEGENVYQPQMQNPMRRANPYKSPGRMRQAMGQPGEKKPMPPNFVKMERERIAKALASDDVLTDLARDWAAHLSGEREFAPANVNFMAGLVNSMNPQVRKVFNAYVGMKLAPGAKYDPDGVSDLIACAGDCLHH